MKKPKHSFRETNLVLQLISESQIKTVMIWSSRKKNEGVFCTVYFVRSKFFYNFCFISMYCVLTALSEYTYFFISKNITLYTFLLVFKIVESLQCIIKFHITSIYSVLNAISEYTYFFISKALLQKLFCLFLKSSKAFSASLNFTFVFLFWLLISFQYFCLNLKLILFLNLILKLNLEFSYGWV